MIRKLKQKLSGLFDDREARGVSPVIGVILMVAITVILAAVIGAFVLGLGDDLGGSTAPTAQLNANDNFDSSNNKGIIELTHNGGDELTAGDLKLIAYEDGAQRATVDVSEFSGGSFAIGERIDAKYNVNTGTATDPTVNEVRLIHEPSSSTLTSVTFDDKTQFAWDTS